MTRLRVIALIFAVGAMTGCAPNGTAEPDTPMPTSARETSATPAATSPQPGSTVAVPTPAERNPTNSVAPVIPTIPQTDSVLPVIAEHPDLTIFSGLVMAFVGTGQGSVFTQTRGLTVLAPTDEAMGDLGRESLRTLADDPDALARWMASHVAIGAATIDHLDGGVVLNAAGQSLSVDRAGEMLRIGDNEVVDADLTAENGVVHVIAGTVALVS